MKEFLKELEFYCNNENGLEEKKDKNRGQYNLKKILKELESQKSDEEIKKRYDSNISMSKEFVKGLDIVHTTTLPCLISIIQNGALLSIAEMERKDISFNYLISFRGINEDMFKYVFGTVGKADAIYGQYEIKLKRQIEAIESSKFLPKSNLEYGEEVLKDYICDLKYWRAYLAEHIAVNYELPDNYITQTPVHLRPQLLLNEKIPLSYIESITCSNQRAYKELVDKIKSEFADNAQILSLVKIAN